MTHLALLVGVLASTPEVPNTADVFRRRGLDAGYNLDYPEAVAAFEQAIRADPSDPAAHRLAAAVIWMRMLFLQGAVTVEDYLGQARASARREPPPPDLAALFDSHIDTSLALAEHRLRQQPSDADAHFQLGAALALRTTYIATIRGTLLDSLGTGRRGYKAHKRALSLDPRRKDAALVVGMYRYTVASLSLPLRLMARLAGFEGGRESGLRLIEEAAAYPSPGQTNARLTLLLMYNREGRHDDALDIVRDLQRRYPRNRLLQLEAASTALRAGRAPDALRSAEEGLARFADDARPKAYGEEAQWRFQRGAALLALGDVPRAHDELRRVTLADAPEWLRDRARKLLVSAGKGAR
jgi:tetratricopeptide (TPR) repeat protein